MDSELDDFASTSDDHFDCFLQKKMKRPKRGHHIYNIYGITLYNIISIKKFSVGALQEDFQGQPSQEVPP